jgi:hypothetical protein
LLNSSDAQIIFPGQLCHLGGILIYYHLILKLKRRRHQFRFWMDVERLVTPNDGVTHRTCVTHVFRNGEDA